MSIVIDLPRPVEARIEREARQAGVSPAELVADVLEKKFTTTPAQPEQEDLSGSSLIQSWIAEAEKPRSAAEMAEAEEDLMRLMKSLNATRREAGERIHFPDIEE